MIWRERRRSGVKIDSPLHYQGPPFATIKDACKITGFSQCFLRTGCKNGTVPHVKIGTGGKYLVDIPAFLASIRAGYSGGQGGGSVD